MKIAFWSNQRKKGGTSTNLVCMAAVMAVSGMGKSVLLENHYHVHNLGSRLMTSREPLQLNESGHYYEKYGIEYILKRLYIGEDSETLVRQSSIPFLYDSIYYIPQSYIVNKEVFNYEFDMAHKQLFSCLENFSQMVFIDTEAHGNASTLEILQEADLVVVNLDQTPEAWEEFFENYQALKEKAVFLVGRYQKDLIWNVGRLRKRFHLTMDHIGVVPYNMELEMAMQEGKTLQFLSRNYQHNYDADNEYLMRQLKKSAFMLRRQMMKRCGGQNSRGFEKA